MEINIKKKHFQLWKSDIFIEKEFYVKIKFLRNEIFKEIP